MTDDLAQRPARIQAAQRCDLCVLWVPVADGRGECHRYAPRPVTQPAMAVPGASENVHRAPITTADFWCGDFQATESPETPPQFPPAITSISPTSGPLPNADIVVNGTDFTSNSKMFLDWSERPTIFVSVNKLLVSIVGFASAAGAYDLFVRDALGDSNVVKFTFS